MQTLNDVGICDLNVGERLIIPDRRCERRL
jgi:hypothetical protein